MTFKMQCVTSLTVSGNNYTIYCNTTLHATVWHVMMNYFVRYNQTCFFTDAKQRLVLENPIVKKTLGCALKVCLNVSFGGFECSMVLYCSLF